MWLSDDDEISQNYLEELIQILDSDLSTNTNEGFLRGKSVLI